MIDMMNVAYLCIWKNMMILIRKIGAILLVTLLITTTGGFSVYNHICSCLGSSSASIFYKTSCEHEDSNETTSCCSLDKIPSCCTEKPVTLAKATCHKDDCCRTSIQFLKISDSFQPGLEKISLKSFAVASVLIFADFSKEYDPIPPLNLLNVDLPPPDSGRQIILAHHQLKIAPPLV